MSLYEGPFKKGERFGHGVHTWPNGTQFEGTFEDNKISGKGTLKFVDSSSYEG